MISEGFAFGLFVGYWARYHESWLSESNIGQRTIQLNKTVYDITITKRHLSMIS